MGVGLLGIESEDAPGACLKQKGSPEYTVCVGLSSRG